MDVKRRAFPSENLYKGWSPGGTPLIRQSRSIKEGGTFCQGSLVGHCVDFVKGQVLYIYVCQERGIPVQKPPAAGRCTNTQMDSRGRSGPSGGESHRCCCCYQMVLKNC